MTWGQSIFDARKRKTIKEMNKLRKGLWMWEDPPESAQEAFHIRDAFNERYESVITRYA